MLYDVLYCLGSQVAQTNHLAQEIRAKEHSDSLHQRIMEEIRSVLCQAQISWDSCCILIFFK
jgi:hypothetical protein